LLYVCYSQNQTLHKDAEAEDGSVTLGVASGGTDKHVSSMLGCSITKLAVSITFEDLSASRVIPALDERITANTDVDRLCECYSTEACK